MKKYLLVLAAFAVTATTVNVNGQESGSLKQKAKSYALEVGFSPFALEGDNIYLQNGQVRAIYAVSDKLGIRLGLGFSAVSSSDDNGLTGDAWEQRSDKSTGFKVSPGLVYSLAGTSRLTPYVGVELNFGTTMNTATIEGRDFKQVVRNDGEVFNTIGLGVFSGFNYYLAKNLYAGAEIGIEFESKSLRNTVTETTTSGTTETSEPKNKVSNTAFGTVFNPSIRLGWVF
jgi:outer membrane protein W